MPSSIPGSSIRIGQHRAPSGIDPHRGPADANSARNDQAVEIRPTRSPSKFSALQKAVCGTARRMSDLLPMPSKTPWQPAKPLAARKATVAWQPAAAPTAARDGQAQIGAARPQADGQRSLDEALASLDREFGAADDAGDAGGAGSAFDDLDRVLDDLSRMSAAPAGSSGEAVAEVHHERPASAVAGGQPEAPAVLDHALDDQEGASSPSSTAGGGANALAALDDALAALNAAADSATGTA